MRAAAFVTPGEAGRAGPAEQADKTLAAGANDPPPRSVRVETDRMVPRQLDGEVIGDGRSLNAQIETGALVVRVPQPVATAA